MKKVVLVLAVVLLFYILVQPCVADVQPSVYIREDYAVPVEIWGLLICIGIVLLILGVIANAMGKVIFGILGMGFFAVSAYAAPMVGYVTTVIINNTSDDSGYDIIPTTQFVAQWWVMWFLWGIAIICFFVMVWGILIYLKELQEVEETGKWI